ncbi:MAG: hypothetical protein J6T98_10485 [Salinivirgaceae bacterium]|nr:hypothetical protein [Salinivirgaceae bacterium]
MNKQKKTDKEKTDIKWIKDFLAMPHNYEQTVEEAKAIILKNRNFGVTRQIKKL